MLGQSLWNRRIRLPRVFIISFTPAKLPPKYLSFFHNELSLTPINRWSYHTKPHNLTVNMFDTWYILRLTYIYDDQYIWELVYLTVNSYNSLFLSNKIFLLAPQQTVPSLIGSLQPMILTGNLKTLHLSLEKFPNTRAVFVKSKHPITTIFDYFIYSTSTDGSCLKCVRFCYNEFFVQSLTYEVVAGNLKIW